MLRKHNGFLSMTQLAKWRRIIQSFLIFGLPYRFCKFSLRQRFLQESHRIFFFFFANCVFWIDPEFLPRYLSLSRWDIRSYWRLFFFAAFLLCYWLDYPLQLKLLRILLVLHFVWTQLWMIQQIVKVPIPSHRIWYAATRYMWRWTDWNGGIVCPVNKKATLPTQKQGKVTCIGFCVRFARCYCYPRPVLRPYR